jgi:hypothetical protein
MKVRIKKIGRKEIDTKVGKRWNMSIQAEDGTWYSGWPSRDTQNWKEGQVVDIDVTDKQVGDKVYHNFMPHMVSQEEVMSTLKEILTLVKALNLGPAKKKANSKGGMAEEAMPILPEDDIPPPNDEDEPPVDSDETPF